MRWVNANCLHHHQAMTAIGMKPSTVFLSDNKLGTLLDEITIPDIFTYIMPYNTRSHSWASIFGRFVLTKSYDTSVCMQTFWFCVWHSDRQNRLLLITINNGPTYTHVNKILWIEYWTDAICFQHNDGSASNVIDLYAFVLLVFDLLSLT